MTHLAVITGELLFGADVLLRVSAGLLAVPSLVLLTECAASALPRRKTPRAEFPRPRVAALVPAHNESLHIAETAAAICTQLEAGDRALVVADNCTDDTATRARDAGAEVLERADQERRGKGFALAAGIELLSARPPEVLVLLDADVPPPPQTVDRLCRRAHGLGKPVQAVYLLRSLPDAGTRSILSEFAFLVKNAVRPTGLTRLGLPVLLTGTGIALPWTALKDISLASGDIVEDMKLGLDLLLAGHAPVLCEEVVLRGGLPETQPSALTQRTRWEHGHLSVARRYVPRLLWAGLTRFDVRLVAAALDLAVPPLALLVAANAVVAIGALALGLATRHWAAAIVSASSLACIFVAIFVAWLGYARHIPFLRLCGAPLYILWKIPLYLRFLTGRAETRWVRTQRE